jgi:hypothetical protein
VLKVLLAAAICVLTFAPQVFAQDGSGTSKPSVPSANAAPITVVGCLTGIDGRYTIGTSSDKIYTVEGDPDQLRRFNSVTVKITGVVGPSKHETSHTDALSYQLQTLTVSKIKKVADSCN